MGVLKINSLVLFLLLLLKIALMYLLLNYKPKIKNQLRERKYHWLNCINSSRVFTDFGLVIRGQSVTQGSMGHKAPRYPPWGQGL